MTVEKGSTPESPPVETSATPASTPVVAATESKDASAESSPAKDESLLGRVKEALKPKTEGSSPSQASQDAKPSSETPSEDDDKEPESDPTEEEKARYHSKTRKQVNRLLRQRNDALDKVKDMEPRAQGFDKVTSFLQENSITSDEANLLFDVAKNLKRDPLKALEQLKPYYDALQRMAGEVLPPDLQESVKKGEITDAHARQMVRMRTETATLSQKTQEQEQAARQQSIASQNKAHAANVGQTISDWEANQAKNDPDWKLKQGRIGELIELEIRRVGQYPSTTKAAIDMAEKARNQVNAEFAHFAPRKAMTAINPASAARPAPPKPSSALEAAKQRLASMAG